VTVPVFAIAKANATLTDSEKVAKDLEVTDKVLIFAVQ